MLEQGTIVAGYRIDGVLGDGGMGVVYRATQLSLGREVALKLLSSDLGADSGFRTRFQREGQIQAGLDHDHIVPVYEAGESEHGLFLAMRMIDGPTLKDLILAGELDPRRTLRLLAQVARALDTAHAAGLIHRDIKPQNILIDPGDHAFLADFGLIKAPDEAARLTGTGQFIGTIDYVAPEQIQGEPASAVSDIYALAGVLYECLTGEVPFPRPNEAATLHSHVIAPAPRVTELRPDLPPAIDDVIARGMAKDPAGRPQSASELIMASSRALASASGFATAPDGAGLASAQPTVVRPRPPAVPRSSSTPALDRASDGATSEAEHRPSLPVAPVAALAPLAPEPLTEEPAVASAAPATVQQIDVAEPEAPAEPVQAPEREVREAQEPQAHSAFEAPVAVPDREEPSTVPAIEEPRQVSEIEETEPEAEYEESAPESEYEEAEPDYEEPEPGPELGESRPVDAAPTPAPAAPARARHSRRVLGALTFLVLAVAAGVAGYLIGHSRPRSALAGFTNSAAVNHVQLRYPSTWQLSAGRSVIPGMSFDAPLVLTRTAGTGGTLTAGTVAAAGGPTLLSRSFRARLVGPLPAPQPVRIGATEADRYTGVQVRGVAGPMTLYATPTSAGVVTIACVSPTGADSALETDCGRIASTLRILGVSPYPLGPSPGYAGLLSATFGRLRASVSGPQAALGGAKTPSAEASAANQLAGAYGAAAGELTGAAVPPMVRDVQGAILDALRRLAAGYGSAAAAASAEAQAGYQNTLTAAAARTRAGDAYRSAAGAIATASTALSQALQGLRTLGYTLTGQR